MNKHFISAFVVSALALAPVNLFAMQDWPTKNVSTLMTAYDGADCFYFTLKGVAEADPVKPGDPTFAIPRTQFGAKDGYAMLLAAKLSGSTVRVVTRGTLSCGYASVAWITME